MTDDALDSGPLLKPERMAAIDKAIEILGDKPACRDIIDLASYLEYGISPFTPRPTAAITWNGVSE